MQPLIENGILTHNVLHLIQNRILTENLSVARRELLPVIDSLLEQLNATPEHQQLILNNIDHWEGDSWCDFHLAYDNNTQAVSLSEFEVDEQGYVFSDTKKHHVTGTLREVREYIINNA